MALRMARELGERSLVLEALVRTLPALTGPDTIDDLLAASDEIVRLDGAPATWWSAEAFLARHYALIQRSDAAGAYRALEAFGECARILASARPPGSTIGSARSAPSTRANSPTRRRASASSSRRAKGFAATRWPTTERS